MSIDRELHLAELQGTFMAALEARRRRDVDRAIDLLKEVVRGEPRLPEPHLELGSIHLEAGRLDEAEAEIRLGLEWLERGGQWVDDLSEEVMRSLAHRLLGETLMARAETDEVVFGDPGRFRELVEEARRHLARAAELDPTDRDAERQAFFLGLGQPGEE